MRDLNDKELSRGYLDSLVNLLEQDFEEENKEPSELKEQFDLEEFDAQVALKMKTRFDGYAVYAYNTYESRVPYNWDGGHPDWATCVVFYPN